MFNKLKTLWFWFNYKKAELRNFYSHKAVGQKTNEDGDTIILYTILGKRYIYTISIQNLMETKELLERFHPCQAAKFGSIAMGEVLFSLPSDKREMSFKKIKNQMLATEDE